ncbi:hypothetical protein R3P38DRAFT_2533649 [Favolaschia claudopus]|uniref:F-box domain-containing protein n=1 Tax=Favolaschia claudopus TaxID=2862362 RepID=A0AAW0B8W2_9AGAR
MRDFPQELVDCTLDELSNDLDTLKSCALVSASWTYRSQSHLFSEIRLATTRETGSLTRTLHNNPSLAHFPRNLEIWFDGQDRTTGVLAKCCSIRNLSLLWAMVAGTAESGEFASLVTGIENSASLPGLSRRWLE